MYKINSYIYSVKVKFFFTTNLNYEIGILDFFNIFDFKYTKINSQIEYQPFQEIKMNKSIFDRFSAFVDKYSFNKKKQLRKLKENEKFILFLEVYTDSNNSYELKDIIEISQENLLEIYNIDKEIMHKYKNVTLKYYNLKTTIHLEYNNKYTYNLNIEPRVCKYCGNTDKKYFKNHSHIIPESVCGHLIDKLECDKCNSWFNGNIEQDFIEFLNIDRTIFGISGKNGIPKIENSSVKIEHYVKDNKNTLVFKIKDSKITPYNLTSENFSFNKKINFNYLYKTLCKIALGVLDYKDMNIYTDTIEWIKDLKSTKKVPHIIIYRYGGTVSDIEKPYINIFIRKNYDYNLPHIFVELNCKFVSFHYILPFSKNDKNDFLEEGLVEKIYKDIFMFKHTEYTVYDCKKKKKVDVKFNINFNLT